MPKRTRETDALAKNLDSSLKEIFDGPDSVTDKLCLASTEWIHGIKSDYFLKLAPFVAKLDQESLEATLFKQVPTLVIPSATTYSASFMRHALPW